MYVCVYIYIYAYHCLHVYHIIISMFIIISSSSSIMISILYIYTYIYIYVYMYSAYNVTCGGVASELISSGAVLGKGQMGSALTGSLQISCLFDRGTFWALPLTYFCIPKSARAYLFPQSLEFITCAEAPLVLTSFLRSQAVGICTTKTPRVEK